MHSSLSPSLPTQPRHVSITNYVINAPLRWSTSFMLKESLVPVMEMTLTLTAWPRRTAALGSRSMPAWICPVGRVGGCLWFVICLSVC